MRIGRKEVVVLADFMRVFVGEKMEESAHPELPSPPPIVAPSTSLLKRRRDALATTSAGPRRVNRSRAPSLRREPSIINGIHRSTRPTAEEDNYTTSRKTAGA